MPFFQGASDFEINGGSFQDIRGNQYNTNTDASFKIQGNDNTTRVAPDHSRTDNRAFLGGNPSGPMHGQQSTYPGYGQTPPGAAPQVPMQSTPGEDQDPMLRKLKALYRLHWTLASQCHAAILAYQGGQQPAQHLLDHAERMLNLPQQQLQQPTQYQLPQQPIPRTSSAPPFPQEGDETSDLRMLRERLERQHIQNHFEHAAASVSMSASTTSHQYLSTRS